MKPETDYKIRVAAYARFSSDNQRPSSIHDQLRNCQECAAKNDFEILESFIFHDEAKSGTTVTGRDQLAALLKASQDPSCPFEGILIDDTSRLARNLSEVLTLSDKFAAAGKFLYFVSYGLDSREAERFRLMLVALGQMDEWQSKSTSQKVHRGQKGRVLDGYVPCGRLYGYQSRVIYGDQVSSGNDNARTIGRKRIINEEEARVVKRIFTLHAQGESPGKIAKLLNDEGVPSSLQYRDSKRRWAILAVRGILRNRAYLGFLIWNRTKVSRDPHTGKHKSSKRDPSEIVEFFDAELTIISLELWERVQAEQARRSKTQSRKFGGLERTEKSSAYFLSGLLRCGQCEESVVTAGPNLYGCYARRIRGTCANNNTLHRDRLEKLVLKELQKVATSSKVRETFISQVEQSLAAYAEEMSAASDSIEDSVDVLKERCITKSLQAERIVDSIMEETDERLRRRLQVVDQEINLLRRQIIFLESPERHCLTSDAVSSSVDRRLADLSALLKEDATTIKSGLPEFVSGIVLQPAGSVEERHYKIIVTVAINLPHRDIGVLSHSLTSPRNDFTRLEFQFGAELPVATFPSYRKEL